MIKDRVIQKRIKGKVLAMANLVCGIFRPLSQGRGQDMSEFREVGYRSSRKL